MQTPQRTLLPLALSLALAAGCGGGDTATAGDESTAGGEAAAPHGEAHAHHEGGEAGEHPELPPEVRAFHDLLAPVWHADPGEARAEAACAAVAPMRDAARAIQDADAPEAAAADPEGWAGAAGALGAAVEALGTRCEEAPADSEEQLPPVHEAFHGLIERLRPPER